MSLLTRCIHSQGTFPLLHQATDFWEVKASPSSILEGKKILPICSQIMLIIALWKGNLFPLTTEATKLYKGQGITLCQMCSKWSRQGSNQCLPYSKELIFPMHHPALLMHTNVYINICACMHMYMYTYVYACVWQMNIFWSWRLIKKYFPTLLRYNYKIMLFKVYNMMIWHTCTSWKDFPI